LSFATHVPWARGADILARAGKSPFIWSADSVTGPAVDGRSLSLSLSSLGRGRRRRRRRRRFHHSRGDRTRHRGYVTFFYLFVCFFFYHFVKMKNYIMFFVYIELLVKVTNRCHNYILMFFFKLYNMFLSNTKMR